MLVFSRAPFAKRRVFILHTPVYGVRSTGYNLYRIDSSQEIATVAQASSSICARTTSTEPNHYNLQSCSRFRLRSANLLLPKSFHEPVQTTIAPSIATKISSEPQSSDPYGYDGLFLALIPCSGVIVFATDSDNPLPTHYATMH